VIRLLAIGGEVNPEWLDDLAADLARVFADSSHVVPGALNAAFAFDPARNQYHSTAILASLAESPAAASPGARLLGIAVVDLFVPVFTFVFGEAQLQGRCALVSLHRLREEFYGLPARYELLRARLLKESVHELGHTFGLRHCEDWRCVMASSHSIERLDAKSAEFCRTCRARVRGSGALS
jgi:archaemetzincin